jgi:hypothetical protein
MENIEDVKIHEISEKGKKPCIETLASKIGKFS